MSLRIYRIGVGVPTNYILQELVYRGADAGGSNEESGGQESAR